MKRLPLALVLSAFFIFLALEVSIRQAVLMLVGVGMGAALRVLGLVLPLDGAS
jgi:hypothetical protein